MKINVIGCTGSGKTTLGKVIASRLTITSLDLDEISWAPNWTERPKSAVWDDLREVLKQDSWVISGDYRIYRHIIMKDADYILWLDYPFWTNFFRLMKRTMRRIVFKEPCCNGNYETLYQVCFTKESIIYWFFKTFWEVNKRNAGLIQDNQLGSKVVRLQSDAETQTFINLISNQAKTESCLGLEK